MTELTFLVGNWKTKKKPNNMLLVLHNKREYSIDLENKTCSCPDFLYRGGYDKQHICKHLRFVMEMGYLNG